MLVDQFVGEEPDFEIEDEKQGARGGCMKYEVR